MEWIPTRIAGCYRVRVRPFSDARGHFVTVFDLEEIRRVDPAFAVARLNRSLTRPQGAIRGLHYQREPHAEDKLIQCLRGAIFDVCVDLRPASPTYLRWEGSELSAENQELVVIPKGCAHGFQTLQENSVVEYLTTGAYSPKDEGGLRWDDPSLGIRWPLRCTMTSERDQAWPLLTPSR